jgi:hypothetical protein
MRKERQLSASYSREGLNNQPIQSLAVLSIAYSAYPFRNIRDNDEGLLIPCDFKFTLWHSPVECSHRLTVALALGEMITRCSKQYTRAGGASPVTYCQITFGFGCSALNFIL